MFMVSPDTSPLADPVRVRGCEATSSYRRSQVPSARISCERTVDESDQVVVALLDADAVGLDAQAVADDLDVRVLQGKPFQHDVVSADRVDLSLLQHQEAVGPIGRPDQGRPRLECEHPRQ